MNNDVPPINAVSAPVLKQPLSTLENGSIKNNSSSTTNNLSSKSSVNTTGVIASSGMSKDDTIPTDNQTDDVEEESEAETVVMPGKEHIDGAPVSSKRTIRHEGAVSNIISIKDAPNGVSNGTKIRSISGGSRHEGTTTIVPLNDRKSHAESSHSSPSASTTSHDHQEHRSRSRATSESNKSRSDPNESTVKPTSRKRKVSMDETDDKSVKRRIKTEEHDGAGSRRPSANARSESPAGPTRQRASTISSPTTSKSKRKAPPPLVVGVSKRKHSVDGDSNDSQSPRHSAAPRLTSGSVDTGKRKGRDKSGRTRFARACAADNLEEAQEMLDLHPDHLDIPDNDGNTPLQIAALEGNIDIVHLLLKKGCNLDTQNNDLKDTPLIDAVENGHLDVVQALIAAGVNPRKVNAKGEEALDLVKTDEENGPQIKEELSQYRTTYDATRRESKRSPDNARYRSPRDSPPLTATSPPPFQQTGRRRAHRGESSRNDLLYINGSASQLLGYASRGDAEGVGHCLNMRSTAEIEAVYAAAKGGHYDCLEILLGMSDPKPDPNPAPLENHNRGHNTPMLVAIGKGKPLIVDLLLRQEGFDPTRRMYKNQTYYEIAEKRQGDGWREEYNKLKEAYDKKVKDNKKHVAAKTNRTSSPKDQKKAQIERSPLTAVTRDASPSASRNGLTRKKPHSESIKPDPDEPSREKRVRDRQSSESKTDRKHLRIPNHDSRESSDREGSPALKRSTSDHESAPRPRKRLVRGIEREQQRSSLGSTSSVNSTQDGNKARSSQEEPIKPRAVTTDESKDKKKTIRRSASPQPEAPKRSKAHSDDHPHRSNSGSAKVAQMSRHAISPGSAPIANMGSTAKEARIKTAIQTDSTPAPRDTEEKPRVKRVEKVKTNKPKVNADENLEKEITVSDELPVVEGPPKPDLKPLDPVTEANLSTNGKVLSRSISPVPSATVDDDMETAPTENESTAELDKITPQSDSLESPSKPDLDDIDNVDRMDDTESESKAQALADEKAKELAALQITNPEDLPDLLKIVSAERETYKNDCSHRFRSPLLCMLGSEIDADCPEAEKTDLWLTNFQAFFVLVDVDINLTGYPEWPRKPMSDSVRSFAWELMALRNCLIKPPQPLWYQGKNLAYRSVEDTEADLKLVEEQFFKCDWFFVRLSDFMAVVPDYPHLMGKDIPLKTIKTAAEHQAQTAAIHREIEEQQAKRRKLNPRPRPAGWIFGVPQPELEPECRRLEEERKRELAAMKDEVVTQEQDS